MSNPHKGRTGFDRIIKAAGYSYQGLRAAYKHESAFRQETVAAVFVIPAAFWVGRAWHEIVILLAVVFLVLIAELTNSAIEAVVDRVSLEHHELSKRAKDIGSAAVFLALVLFFGVWLSALYFRLTS